jgi:single-strand DNA-binding protein
MASLNKVIIIGNLGRDPETKYLPSGDCVTTIAVATTEAWKDKQTGEKKEATEWHRISFFGKLAEIAAQYLKKGSQVYIEGSLRTREYTDKDGAKKYATDIKASEMKMLGGKSEAQQQTPAPRQAAPKTAQQAPNFSDMDDDIPF